LTISQSALAALYISPANDNPGSLHFENVQVDTSINVSAQLTATDKDSIHAGQLFQLNLDQLAKRRARGYRNINNFINMIYFLCGKMKFDYPLYFT